MNKKIKFLAVSTALTSVILLNSTYALNANSLANNNSIDVNNHIYTVEDFVIKDKKIYGFSDKGLKKLKENPIVKLPSFDEKGNPITKIASFAFTANKMVAIDEFLLKDESPDSETYGKDYYGEKIEKLGGVFRNTEIEEVIIPEGYVEIGPDAFRDNKNLKKITFPRTLKHIKDYACAHTSINNLVLNEGLEKIDDTSFFDAEIKGKLIIPESVCDIGERAFKNNQIHEVIFNGEKLEELKEQVFEDNQIEEITIPGSIKKISPDAFNANSGSTSYARRVVVKYNGNSDLLDGVNFYVNPSEDKRTDGLDIDASEWDLSDFIIEGKSIKGFSTSGFLKILKNKNLILPNKNKNGEDIVEVAADAFRNVDFDESSIKKYDIESVVLPKNIEKIGDFAFQSNNIKEIDFSENNNLKEIGKGAFMNNKIESLLLNDEIEKIDDAAFHINKIEMLFLQGGHLKYIGKSSFRQNNISILYLISNELKEISDMAFLENDIQGELDLSQLPNLKKIGVQSFRNNSIEKLNIPDSLEEISAEAFYNNKIETLNISDNVKLIMFNAFDTNDGSGKSVIINTVGNKNINRIADGNNFKIDPSVLAVDKTELINIVNEIKNLDKRELRESTRKQFDDIIANGEELIKNEKLTRGQLLKFVKDTKFFLGRVDLDKAMEKANKAILNKSLKENEIKILKNKLNYANTAYNNAASPSWKIDRTSKELNLLSDLCLNKGEISKANMVQGVYKLESPLPIPPYYIGVNMYFDDQGKILYVLDMSYTIGEGTKNEFGADVLNVDEDNEGYHELAIRSLSQYDGKNIKDILNSDFSIIKDYGDLEKYHVEGIFNAVKDACKDAKILLDKNSAEKTNPLDENIDDFRDHPKISIRNNSVKGEKVYVQGKLNGSSRNERSTKDKNKKVILKLDSNKYFEVTPSGKIEKEFEFKPFVKDGRTMLPIRFIAEFIGLKVTWIKDTRTVIFEKDNKKISINVDDDKIIDENGNVIKMDTKGVIKKDRFYLPLTNVSKLFNLTTGNIKDNKENDIEYKEDTREIIINIRNL